MPEALAQPESLGALTQRTPRCEEVRERVGSTGRAGPGTCGSRALYRDSRCPLSDGACLAAGVQGSGPAGPLESPPR